MKRFCNHPNLTWEHVNNIPSHALTSFTKGPQYAVTSNFANFIQADMNFRHCLSPFFHWSSIYQLYGVINKGTVVHFCSYGNRRRRVFRFFKQRNQILVCIYFIHRYLLLRTLLSLPWMFCRINAASSLWMWDAFFIFTLQRPGDLICIPHLLAHAVLTLNTGSPTVLSGRDAATTTNQQFIIQTFNEYTFGVRRGKWREIFRGKWFISITRIGIFSLSRPSRK